MELANHIPRRLTEVRTMAGLTQGQLARRMELSPSLIHYWESGDRKPSQEQLHELSRHLGVSLGYLVKDKVQPTFQYRSKAAALDTDAAEIAKMQLDASAQIDYIDEIFRLAEQPIPHFSHWSEFTFPQTAQLTRQYRHILGLNRRVTLAELKQAMAEQGIFVFEWELPDQICGMSYRNGISAVFINSLHPPTRRLFTLAHELAHVLFHLGRKPEASAQLSLLGNNKDPEEKEANAFATELLMPIEDVQAVIDRYGEKILDPMLMECIARSFNVSRDAFLYSLTKLKFCTWKDQCPRLASPFKVQKPSGYRVTKINEQVPTALLENVLCLRGNTKSPTQMTDWLFTAETEFHNYIEDLSNVLRFT